MPTISHSQGRGDAATAVAVPRPVGDGLLAVAVRGGAAELSGTVLLRGLARRLFERHGAGLDEEAAARELLAAGAETEEAALRDARAFVEELAASGLVGEADRGTDAREETADEPREDAAPRAAGDDSASLEAADLESVARAVLAAGHRLRYRAYGRSMRPQIPHGSTLVVEPREAAAVRTGEVVLFSVGETRLVAHRVVGRAGSELLLLGDSCARLDRVAPGAVLGVVTERISPGGGGARVSSGPRRVLGLLTARTWRLLALTARLLVARPLAASGGLRALLSGGMRVASGVLLRLERAARSVRGPLDVGRAALLTEEEKDEDRRRLYRRRSIQAFTALDENVDAGLTLIEEVALARHPLPAGRTLVLGCGPGRECLALARLGHRVTGVDREEGMLTRAEERTRAAGLEVRYVLGEAVDAGAEALAGETFDLVVVFSGLYDMVLPRHRREALLAAARERLEPGGQLLLTFLSAYVPPGSGAAPPTSGGFWRAVNADHEAGDRYLLNEAVHVFPRGEDVAAEARAAGFEVEALYRDQRAYDRDGGQVRGYALLRRSER